MPAVTHTITVSSSKRNGKERYSFSTTVTGGDANTFLKIQGLPASAIMRLLRVDVVSSVNNQAGFYFGTTADQTDEIHKAGSASTRTQAPAVSGALLDSGMWFVSSSDGCIYCAPNLSGAGNVTRLTGVIEV